MHSDRCIEILSSPQLKQKEKRSNRENKKKEIKIKKTYLKLSIRYSSRSFGNVRSRKSCLNTVLASDRKETFESQLATQHQERGDQRFKQFEKARGLLPSEKHVHLQSNFNLGEQKRKEFEQRRK